MSRAAELEQLEHFSHIKRYARAHASHKAELFQPFQMGRRMGSCLLQAKLFPLVPTLNVHRGKAAVSFAARAPFSLALRLQEQANDHKRPLPEFRKDAEKPVAAGPQASEVQPASRTFRPWR